MSVESQNHSLSTDEEGFDERRGSTMAEPHRLHSGCRRARHSAAQGPLLMNLLGDNVASLARPSGRSEKADLFFERGKIALGQPLGARLEHTAHDLPAPGLGERSHEIDLLRFGNRADFMTHMLA